MAMDRVLFGSQTGFTWNCRTGSALLCLFLAQSARGLLQVPMTG